VAQSEPTQQFALGIQALLQGFWPDVQL
jgi:hypothetical protein